jgi:hypothetical protein
MQMIGGICAFHKERKALFQCYGDVQEENVATEPTHNSSLGQGVSIREISDL